MENARIAVYTHLEDIPAIEDNIFFHGKELFGILSSTPGCTPYMFVATDGEGRWLGHLLATLNRRGRLLPPYLYTTGNVLGEGCYRDEVTRDALFPELIHAVTRHFTRRLCLVIEFSQLSKKMLGYRHFRRNGYVPVNWQNIHNSLHSKAPAERLDPTFLRRLESRYQMGVETHEISSEKEFDAFYTLLRNYYRMKFQRFIPKKEFFRALLSSDRCRILTTRYKGRVIGGCAIVYDRDDAYLWYSASRRKTYRRQMPRAMTVWYALNHSHAMGKSHLRFMHVGLPIIGEPTRDFLLDFGGKPTSTYRWFRCSIGWVNRLLRWFFQE